MHTDENSERSGASLVMGPHPQNLDCAFLFEDLVDESMLNVDASRISTRQISDELFERTWSLEGIPRQNFKKRLSLGTKA